MAVIIVFIVTALATKQLRNCLLFENFSTIFRSKDYANLELVQNIQITVMK